MIKSAIEKQKYNEPSKANILKVYDDKAVNRRLNIMDISKKDWKLRRKPIWKRNMFQILL